MDHPSFNEEYVRRLAAGDPDVQRHFILHFSSLLRIKLRTRLRSPQLVEDVRQETFLRVLQAFRKQTGGLQHPERLGAFVNTTCDNVMFETLRATTRQNQIPEDQRDIIDTNADSARLLVSRERREIVQHVLAELPAKDRDLLRQVYFEEREKDDICREMNVTPEYLRVLIHRAKLHFKEKMMATANRPPL